MFLPIQMVLCLRVCVLAKAQCELQHAAAAAAVSGQLSECTTRSVAKVNGTVIT